MKNYRAALLVFLISFTGIMAMAQQGTIKGTVTESDPSATIKDVRITDHTGTVLAISGANGEFLFTAEPGELTIYFYSDGYQQYILDRKSVV